MAKKADVEAIKRDEALSLLEESRNELIGTAKVIAFDLARRNGRVTSPEVVREMRARGVEGLDNVDKRFMGVVFRHPAFTRIGFEPSGSHKQPISVWKLKKEA